MNTEFILVHPMWLHLPLLLMQVSLKCQGENVHESITAY